MKLVSVGVQNSDVQTESNYREDLHLKTMIWWNLTYVNLNPKKTVDVNFYDVKND